MKKDWTEQVRDKLSESAITPPDDMWAGISSELDAHMPMHVWRRTPQIWRWLAMAACLMGVVVCGVFFMTSNQQEQQSSRDMLAETSPSAPIHKDIRKLYDSPQQTVKNDNCKQAVTQYSGKKVITDDEATASQTSIVEDDVDPQLHSQPIGDTDNDCSPPLTREDSTNTAQTTDRIQSLNYSSPHISSKRRGNNRMSVSLYASNTNMPNLNLGSSDLAFVNGSMMDTGNGGGLNSSTGDWNLSTTDYALADVSHRQPLRFGVSVRFPISSSFSLSSGMVYSRLQSTMTWTNSKYMSYEIHQALNYVGIPISLEYSLPSYRSAEFYITAGMMAEKCVYGEKHRHNSPITEQVSERALQMSLSAGAGVQLNVYRNISLYTEPLVTYYIDNHSDIVNIYKDRKLNIDLRIGLRYTLKLSAASH